MRAFFLVLVFALSISVAPKANAVLPESGFYWTPGSGGTGYAVEIQDDFVFVAAYAYGSSGQALFYVIQGRLNVNTGVVNGDLLLFNGGQCIGCPFTAPTFGSIAPARITFQDNVNATIEVFTTGGTARVQIQRFFFALGDNSPRGALLGVWSVVSGALGVYFGDILYVQSFCDPTTIPNEVCGVILDTNRPIIGGQLSGTRDWLMLIDSSTSFFTRLLFRNDGDRWVGLSATYRKTDPTPPATSGLVFIASRVAGVSTASQIFYGRPIAAVSKVRSASDAEKAQQTVDLTTADLAPEHASFVRALVGREAEIQAATEAARLEVVKRQSE